MGNVISKIGFGGGCHWCTEAVFQSVRGVNRTEQGFIRSDPPCDNWSEAVIVHYDETDIRLADLIEIHLRTHASGSAHSMRGKYRSAIYCFTAEQQKAAADVLASLQDGFDETLVTQVLPFAGFRESDQRFQNYYEQGPERPFCQTYIDPKLRILRERFSGLVRESRDVSRIQRSVNPAAGCRRNSATAAKTTAKRI
ncbi:MAG: peptide-methionine (S)-S-oxide reductase [Rhodospirillales bacterium]